MEFGVPVPLLEAIGQVENNWTQIGPSIDQGWGIMHLVENNYCDTLGDAATLLKIERQILKDDARQNIRGAAALLAKFAREGGGETKTLEQWFESVKRFSGLINDEIRELAARRYYEVLREGVTASTLWSETVTIVAHKQISIPGYLLKQSSIDQSASEGDPLSIPAVSTSDIKLNSTDYGPALTSIAPNCNWGTGRNHSINTWVNHWVGVGTYAQAISWFHTCPGSGAGQRGYNPDTGVLYGPTSAHFVIRASDGQITQVVRVGDTAYHAGATGYPYNNTRSIGVEHEVTAANPSQWNSTALLQASATMAHYFCDLYAIPKVRALPGIRGHNEMPGTSTQCPGNLPWTTWMNLLNGGQSPDLTIVEPVVVSPTSVAPGGTIQVDWTEKNKGTAASTPAHNTKIFLSTTAYGTTHEIGYYGPMNTLGVGATQPYSVPAIVVPASIPAGDYYVTAFVDSDQQVSEGSNEGDNIGSSTPTRLTIGVTTSPSMSLNYTGTAIPNGDSSPTAAKGTDFGTVNYGFESPHRSFTIRNDGAAPLNLTGTIRVQIGGNNASDFLYYAPAPSTPVAANGGSTTFILAFEPTVNTGLRTATVTIPNNDPNKNPYTFTVRGTADFQHRVDPELEYNGVVSLDEDLSPSVSAGTDFGSVNVGAQSATHTFQLYNYGNINMTLTGSFVQLSGANSSDFVIVTMPASPIAPYPNGNSTIGIRFQPTGSSLRTASMLIYYDDTDGLGATSPYTVALQGNGSATTRIISLSGDLAFGNVTVGTAGQRTLTIANNGNSTLTVSSINYPGGFSGNWSSGTILAGESQNVTVTFSPSASTGYGGTVTVNSDKTIGANTIEAAGTGTLNPPTANVATTVTNSAFTANWSSASGATGYRLDASTSSTFSSYVSGYQDLDVGNVLSRSVSGLSAGTTYYYRLRAYNTGGTSGNSGTITVTTLPSLGYTRQGNNFVLSWPTNDPAFKLEYATNLPALIWISNQVSPSVVSGQYIVTNAITGGKKFYRLKK